MGRSLPEIRKRLFRSFWQAACNSERQDRWFLAGSDSVVPTTSAKKSWIQPAASSSAKKLSSGSIKKDSVRKTSAGTPSSSKNPADLKKIQSLTVIELSRSLMGRKQGQLLTTRRKLWRDDGSGK
ncbi:unnamed protein product, partial [Mesorhabditis belari]|uniref:Uncharacterized protein n=1 Tax=Mesorhabditis belari TaxID=2138241 RepID=A0AAF3J641_9BILA